MIGHLDMIGKVGNPDGGTRLAVRTALTTAGCDNASCHEASRPQRIECALSVPANNDNVQISAQPGPGFDSSVLDTSEDTDVVTVGLVPSPDHAERIVAGIADELPKLLHEQIDDQVTWQIKVVPDPLTGSNVETPALLDELDEWRTPHGWDYAISVTDLPVRRQKRIVIGEASVERNLAWISLPPLGVLWLRRRVRAAILQMLNEMRWGTPQGNPARQETEHQQDTDSATERWTS